MGTEDHSHDHYELHGVALEYHDHDTKYAETYHDHDEYAEVSHDHGAVRDLWEAVERLEEQTEASELKTSVSELADNIHDIGSDVDSNNEAIRDLQEQFDDFKRTVSILNDPNLRTQLEKFIKSQSL